jgi:hypothetical protein
MQRLECNNQSFSRILFYYVKISYIYIYVCVCVCKKITPLFRKREEKHVKRRVTPEFDGY